MIPGILNHYAMMYQIFSRLVAAVLAVNALSVFNSHAEVSVIWDFSPGNEHGWTTVNGVSWLDANGVTAGQANGGGVADYFGGVNNTGNTRYAHDGAHTNFIFRSPVINFGGVDAAGPVLEMDWFGGQGNQSGIDDPIDPGEVTGAGITTALGQKGLALLNLATGSYDAVYYDSQNGGGLESLSLTQADLVGDGVNLTDNYQLDFFDTDDGSWGWTRLEEVRVDEAALIDAPTYNVSWDFNDGLGGDRTWKVENGLAGFAADGVHAAVEGGSFAEDSPHPVFIFRSPIVRLDDSDPDQEVIKVNFIGGQGNQSGAPEPADPNAVVSYNGGNSDSNGQKGLAFLNLTTGQYDHVIYDSEDAGDNPESIELTLAELVAAGVDAGTDYRLDFFDYDDGFSGWTRLESVNLNGMVIPDPPPPSETDTIWNFSPGNEHGWTTINGVSWLDPNGVEAGQADGVGGNDTGNTRRAHDGAHTNFIYRSPILNFGRVDDTGSVIEFDFEGGGGNQDNAPNPLTPEQVITSGTGITSAVGQKGLGFLNLSTGNYDAVYYDSGNGGGIETIALTKADLTAAGVSLDDDYQLDFFENDDGSWGWTRLNEVRLDSVALGEGGAQSFAITNIDYSPGDQRLTLTWNSREGQTYAVRYSEDMIDWSSDLDDAVDADAGDQTTRIFDLSAAEFTELKRVFFRVERQPSG